MKQSISIARHDAVVHLAMLTGACLLPTVSHLLAVPLYYANPMLLLTVCGMALLKERRNAYLLALTLPLVSCMVVGMPSLAKALCMVVELATIVACYNTIEQRCHTFVAAVFAIAIGKAAYYGAKMLIIGSLAIATPWNIQIATTLLAAATLSLLMRGK